MSRTLKFAPIVRPPAYLDGRICDPSQLEGRDVPVREWLVEGIIPKGKVCLFTGHGGLGKSLLAQQLLTATATGKEWLGQPTTPCKSFGLFCEDDNEELHRRQSAICNSSFLPLYDLWRMNWLSGVGRDNVLMSFDQRTGEGMLTVFYRQLLDFFKDFKPGLVVLDTLADTFGGNEIIGSQVRTFVNGCLNKICLKTGATVVLIGHPSKAGMATGDGYSGNTQWHNTVRSRLYLKKPDDAADPDERVISTMKNNYGPSDSSIEIRYSHGAFVPLPKIGAGAIGDAPERIFLECLAALTQRGSNVSESRNAGNYAPKVMAEMPESGRTRFGDLRKAMFALFTGGEIINEPYGPPSKGRRRIATKPGADKNDT